MKPDDKAVSEALNQAEDAQIQEASGGGEGSIIRRIEQLVFESGRASFSTERSAASSIASNLSDLDIARDLPAGDLRQAAELARPGDGGMSTSEKIASGLGVGKGIIAAKKTIDSSTDQGENK